MNDRLEPLFQPFFLFHFSIIKYKARRLRKR